MDDFWISALFEKYLDDIEANEVLWQKNHKNGLLFPLTTIVLLKVQAFWQKMSGKNFRK